MNHNSTRRQFLSTTAALATACALGGKALAADAKKTVVVWSEGTADIKIYPKDINTAIAEGLTRDLKDWDVVIAGIDQPDQGLNDDLLNKCDVLIWWGHKKHGQVKDELVAKIVKRVKEDGMGFIPLHSSHFAKPNKAVMGTACSWKLYKGDCKTLKVTVKDATHPIAAGVAKEFTIENGERYGDPYVVPTPKSVVLEGEAGLNDGGKDISQIAFTWEMGKGKVFYLQAGHETNPIYFDENIRKIMANAVKWAAR